MILPLLLLLGCQLAGDILSRGFGLPLPGPVLGMMLMLGLLVALPRTVEVLRPLAVILLANISLAFIPAGTGLVAFLGELRRDGLALAVTMIGSTVAALMAGALAFVVVARLTGNRGAE